MTKALLVNPADVDLAAVKAKAALHGVDVIASPAVPLGSAYVTDIEALVDRWEG